MSISISIPLWPALLIFVQFISLAMCELTAILTGEAPVDFNDDANEAHESNHTEERYAVAAFDWNHVQAPFTITLWILLASVAKIGFHLSKKFTSIFPDSSLLIVLGLVVGLVLYFIQSVNTSSFNLDSTVFFIYLLPPIVFDAGYFMPNRAFFDNLGTILTFAVFGTVWNAFSIGLSLWAIGQTGLFSVETPLLSILLFASLISAVDPVAVLVVFEQIHVNEILYIVVFGESLLNDAITVVLYHMFEGFAEIGLNNIIPQDIGLGLVSFFVVGLGGVAIGLIWAVVAGFTTRWTKHSRVLEPLFVFAMAFASYLTAELFHLSGILAIVFCGIAMKQYVEGNISHKSQTTVKYFLKMLSSCSETIIFMFLGLSTVSTQHHWDTAFVGLTVLFCLVYRSIGVVLQTFFVNKLRLVKLNKVDQFIMAYGGLRGAIAYGLVVALDEEVIKAKKMFVTATIVVIYFTVFLQGMTIKPLVNFLKVKKDDKRERTMNEQISERMIDHVLSGVEDILGHRGHHWLRDKYEYYNNKYLKPILLREAPKSADGGILEAFTKMSVREAMDHLARYGSFHSVANVQSDSISNLIRTHSQPSFVREPSLSFVNDQAGNPILDMNVFDAFIGKKIEADSKLHHLLMESIHKQRPKQRKGQPLFGESGVFESTKRYAEQYKLRRLIKDKMFKEVQARSDVDKLENAGRKRVNFFVSDDEKSPRWDQSGNGLPQDDTSFTVPHVYEPVEDTPRVEPQLTAAEKELPWKCQSSTPTPMKRDFAGGPFDSRKSSIVSNAGSEPASELNTTRASSSTLPVSLPTRDSSSSLHQQRARTVLIPMDEREEINEEREISSL